MVRDNASTRASGVKVLRKSLPAADPCQLREITAASRTAVLELVPSRMPFVFETQNGSVRNLLF